jgi:hypothetical protein
VDAAMSKVVRAKPSQISDWAKTEGAENITNTAASNSVVLCIVHFF